MIGQNDYLDKVYRIFRYWSFRTVINDSPATNVGENGADGQVQDLDAAALITLLELPFVRKYIDEYDELWDIY